jgi:hypothetical protein
MTMSIFSVYELDWAAEIFKPLRLAVRGTIIAIWSNASLAQKLTLWQKQGHEHAQAGAARTGGYAARVRAGLALLT